MKSKKEKERARKALDISEFDVSRYDGCERLNALAWAKLLTVRYSLRSLMLGPENQEHGLRKLLDLMHYPVPPLHKVASWQDGLAPMWSKIKYHSVYDAEIYSIWTGRDAIDRHLPEAKEACEWAHSQRAEEFAPPPLAYQSLHSHLLENGLQPRGHCSIWIEDNPLVAVKLNAPDEVIIEHFAEWLRAKRDEVEKRLSMSAPPSFTEGDFRQWHKNRVLAFIDLEMFAYHLGLTFTDEMIGRALFPNEFDVGIGDRVRKTVRPLAQRIMSGAVFDALDWQGAVGYWKAHKEETETSRAFAAALAADVAAAGGIEAVASALRDVPHAAESSARNLPEEKKH